MPYKHRYSQKNFEKACKEFNKMNASSVKRVKAARKRYKNRQQKLSVKTVKAIAKETVKKQYEKYYFEISDHLDRALGNPSIAALALGGNTMPQPHVVLLTDYLCTRYLDSGEYAHTPTVSNGDLKYVQKQDLWIQNIQLSIEATSPYGDIGGRPSSQWCTIHWALIRTTSQPYHNPPLPDHLFKDSWFQQTATFKKLNKTAGVSIVKQGQFDCSPVKVPSSYYDHVTSQSIMVTQNTYSKRVVRRKINIGVNKQIKLLRAKDTAGTNTDATSTGNKNSANYWLVFYSRQQLQGVQSTSAASKLYNNNRFGMNTDNTGASRGGPTFNYTVTITGHGEQP